MNPLLSALARHAAAYPGHIALTDGENLVDYGSLHRAVITLAAELLASGARVVALALPNGPAWMIADLATLAARIACVPVPPFFSASQKLHLLRDAGVDCVLTDDAARYSALLHAASLPITASVSVMVGRSRCARLSVDRRSAPELARDIAKITYTSGTTGAPKGVCLRAEALDTVAHGLATACELGRQDRHSSLLPLATLLENVGVYAHLKSGGCCSLRPLEVIANARTGLDGRGMAQRLVDDAATTAILVPEMLRALVHAMTHGAPGPEKLRVLAVGGAPVSVRLIEDARRLGLPVYEGYGLSECASVVALNTRHADKPGTVGRPLPHVALRFTADNEILVRGALYSGYIGECRAADAWLPTGDRGVLDEDGLLRLTGRSKNIFITSYGRNVSPEWVEAELTAHAAIAQAWVYGEARPWNIAVITPRADAETRQIDDAIRTANAALPEYARVRHWVRSTVPFSAANGQLTANGLLRRDALLAAYTNLLEETYAEHMHDVS